MWIDQSQVLRLKLWLETFQQTKVWARGLHRQIVKYLRRVNIYPSENPKICREETLPNSFNEATILLIPKPYKDTTEKKITSQYHWWIWIVGIFVFLHLICVQDAKILNKILTIQIQQYIKRIIHHDQVGLSQGCKDFSISTDQCESSHQQSE